MKKTEAGLSGVERERVSPDSRGPATHTVGHFASHIIHARILAAAAAISDRESAGKSRHGRDARKKRDRRGRLNES